MARESKPTDLPGLEALYPAAFPDEDLLALMRSLEVEPDVLSLVLDQSDAIIGHVAFTPCTISDDRRPLALLGPLAIHPKWQKQGWGGALVREGLARLRKQGVAGVLVLGDPAYYGRFGFVAEPNLSPPHPLPDEWAGAWQSLALGDENLGEGQLKVPPVWDNPKLWV
ncbi:MAG: N-acetyltransferase [Rhizobiales bacterium]|nr:N-acetyltransferase [Hyphomicrobiales bacterium]